MKKILKQFIDKAYKESHVEKTPEGYVYTVVEISTLVQLADEWPKWYEFWK